MLIYKLTYLREIAFKFPPLFLWRKKGVNEVIKEIKKLRPKSILDVGCGTGFLSKIIKSIDKNIEYTGIDISISMINYAKKYYGIYGKFYCKDFLNYLGKHDLILFFYSFMFFRFNEAMKKIKEILLEGGSVIIITCYKSILSYLYFLILRKLFCQKIYFYSPKYFNVNYNLISEIEASYKFLLQYEIFC